MNILRKSTNDRCTHFRFNKELNVFELYDLEGTVFVELKPEVHLIDDYDPQNFEVKLLHNDRQDCTEQSIYQVYIAEDRIGWIFPVQAIHSKEHNYAENEFFLKYAYVAWHHMLNTCKAEVNEYEDFNLFNCYSEDICILVLDRDNCKKILEFDYDKYVVSLFHNGYSEYGRGNLYSESILHDKRLKLERQSKKLDNVPYITELFKKQIPLETNAISRFYLYYQVIEMLIAKVFDDLFTKYVANLRADNLFDQKEELSDLSNEKNRVRKLCCEYCKVETSLSGDLDNKCKELLDYTDCKQGKSMPDNLYQVRCLIVHKMYVIDEKAQKLLIEIDDLFLELIIQLITTYDT